MTARFANGALTQGFDYWQDGLEPAGEGQSPPLLDDLALPGCTIEVSGSLDAAERCLSALGLRGPASLSIAQPGRDDVVTIRRGGLTIEARLGARPLAPAEDGPVPEPLADLLLAPAGDAVVHLCDLAKMPVVFGPDAVPEAQWTCLFNGEAADEFAAAAPYLVSIPKSSPHLRHLFDDEDMPWSYWPLSPGLFLHLNGPLDPVRGALRKFTYLRDSEGAWRFARIAEPRMIHAFLLGMSPGVRSRFFRGIARIVAINPEEGLVCSFTCDDPAAHAPIGLDQDLAETLAAGARAQFGRRVLHFCRDTLPAHLGPDPDMHDRFVPKAIALARRAGFQSEQAVLLAVAAQWCATPAKADSQPPWLEQQTDILNRTDITSIEKGRALLARAGAMKPIAAPYFMAG